MSVLGPMLIIFLSLPGLLTWWLMHHKIDPQLIAAIPAPRRPIKDFDVDPLFNDWRGFT